MERLKGLSKDVVIYGIGSALGRLASVLTAPILTRVFAPPEYGVLALLQAAVGFLVLLGGLNLNSGVFYHYYATDDPDERRTILSMSFFLHLGLGLLISTAIYVFAPQVARALLLRLEPSAATSSFDYVACLRILAIGVVFQMLQENFHCLLRLIRLPFHYCFLSLLNVGVYVSAILVLVVYKELGLEGTLWAGVLGSVVTGSVGFVLVVKHFRLAFSRSLLRKVLGYCLPAVPGVIFSWSLMQGNRFFLNYYASLAQQGLYDIAWKVTGAFVLLTVAFRTAWDPFALSIAKEARAKQTYARLYKLLIVCLGAAGAVLVLFAKPILFVLTPEPYPAAYVVVPVLVFAFLSRSGNNVLALGISLSERTRFLSWAQAIAWCTNVALAVLCIPRFGAIGAAAAFAGGSLVQGAAYYGFGLRLYPIPYAFVRMQLYALGLFGLVGVQVYLVRDSDLLQSLLWGLCFSPLPILVAWRLGLTPTDREGVRSALRPIASFLKARRRRSQE